jgi:outer membrane autotransporter protein
LKDGPLQGGAGYATDGYQPRRLRFWSRGFGGRGSLDGDASGAAGLDTRVAGFAAGADARIDRTTLAGIVVGYTHSEFSVDQLATSGTAEGMHVGIYGVKRLGPFYLAGAVDYAHFSNNTDRFIDWVVDERARGEFASDMYSARLETGWRLYAGRHRVTPFAGVQVAHLVSEGFTEDSVTLAGAPGILGLTFGANEVTSVTSSLGIQVDTRIALANGQALIPFARVAWVHEFNPDRSVFASLTASPAAFFSPRGTSAASDVAKVNAGVRLEVNRSVGLFAYFDGEFSERSESYAGTGGVRISW